MHPKLDMYVFVKFVQVCIVDHLLFSSTSSQQHVEKAMSYAYSIKHKFNRLVVKIVKLKSFHKKQESSDIS